MMNGRPNASEYNPRFDRYIQLVPEDNICVALAQQLHETVSFVYHVPEPIVDYRYAPGKWTTREVMGHILDTERILGFRLLSFARGDSAPLNLADEELYVKNGEFSRFPLREWVEEYSLLRRSNIALVRHLPRESWERTGIVSGMLISVRALAYIMVGHERHHIQIIQNLYLCQAEALGR
jgi:hypothetical protein